MLCTRTGNFSIGFRRGWTEWSKDLPALIAWAREHEFGVIDLGSDVGPEWRKVTEAGLRVGTADSPEWRKLLSSDAATRKVAVQQNIDHAKACRDLGITKQFFVAIPEKPDLPRKENYSYLIDSLSQLAPELEKLGASIAIEGWPGPGVICCTPEVFRAVLKAIPSRAIGVNYDPSHLIRMGIDPIRFLKEFIDRVLHVHGKDAELLSEDLYEFGHEQPATFAPEITFGAWSWRYTIPGHGAMRWAAAFKILKGANYRGDVCIELEDANFNGTTDGERTGLIAAGRFLSGC